MNLYLSKQSSQSKGVVVDDMILTKDMPTSAGSKMLEGFMSLFDAEVVNKLNDAGIEVSAKTYCGEFAIDLVGETSYYGATTDDGILKNASAEAVKSGEATAAVCLDVNGSVRRSAAQAGLVSIKPTYGTVSRYGTIPVACSGETVSVMAQNVSECQKILDVISGHDDKDGTSLPEEKCVLVKSASASVKKVAILKSMKDGVNEDVLKKIESVVTKVYGGAGVNFTPAAKKQIATLKDLGYDKIPVCMAKTQYSFSDDQTKLGAPEGFVVTVRNVKVSAGAGFFAALTKAISSSPVMVSFTSRNSLISSRRGRLSISSCLAPEKASSRIFMTSRSTSAAISWEQSI